MLFNDINSHIRVEIKRIIFVFSFSINIAYQTMWIDDIRRGCGSSLEELRWVDNGSSETFNLNLTKQLSLQRQRSVEPGSTIGRSFMQNTMQQYMEIMKQTNLEMAKELDRMPIGKFQLVYCHISITSTLFDTSLITSFVASTIYSHPGDNMMTISRRANVPVSAATFQRYYYDSGIAHGNGRTCVNQISCWNTAHSCVLPCSSASLPFRHWTIREFRCVLR